MNQSYNTSYNPEIEADIDCLTESVDCFELILWNDDVNTFDWVIKALIEICHHSPEQAEQCALLVHYKGKYPVAQGAIEILKPLCASLHQRKIGATIEMKP